MWILAEFHVFGWLGIDSCEIILAVERTWSTSLSPARLNHISIMGDMNSFGRVVIFPFYIDQPCS